MLLLLKLLTLHAVAGQRVFGMGSAALCPTQLFLRCPRHGSRPASHSSLTVALRGKDSWFRPYLALWLAEVSGLEWRQISTRSQTDTTVNADRQTDRHPGQTAVKQTTGLEWLCTLTRIVPTVVCTVDTVDCLSVSCAMCVSRAPSLACDRPAPGCVQRCERTVSRRTCAGRGADSGKASDGGEARFVRSFRARAAALLAFGQCSAGWPQVGAVHGAVAWHGTRSAGQRRAGSCELLCEPRPCKKSFSMVRL